MTSEKAVKLRMGRLRNELREHDRIRNKLSNERCCIAFALGLEWLMEDCV